MRYISGEWETARNVAKILDMSEERVIKTPFVELIKKLVGAYVDLEYKISGIEKEKIKSDITLKAIEEFIEERRK